MTSSITLSIRDENFSGKILNELFVDFSSDTVTVKDIIEARVHHEVERYNAQTNGLYNGLVEPGDAEKTINGYKLKQKKKIDAEKQVYVALDAFQKNGFFVLIDDLQSTSLDQPVMLQQSTIISFVKLTALVGG